MVQIPILQTSSVEKELKASVSRCNQLEADLAKLEKASEDTSKLMTQIRQDKEIAAAQVYQLTVDYHGLGLL